MTKDNLKSQTHETCKLINNLLMENIIKIVPLWTKLPEFSICLWTWSREDFSTIRKNSVTTSAISRKCITEMYVLHWNLCCAIQFLCLFKQRNVGRSFNHLAQSYFVWGISLCHYELIYPSRIHFDWRAFFISLISI